MTTPTVCFVGLGYIGLPTSVIMANHGLRVTGFDVNEANVNRINDGRVTIVEPGLEEQLRNALNSGNFRAQTSPTSADVYIIAVPTPFQQDYSVDMRFIYSAAEAIAPTLTGNQLIILESTSPPLTTRAMADHILSLRPDLRRDDADTTPDNASSTLYFAHCPERILPGKAMEELVTNDRIIGGETAEATRRAAEIYGVFCTGTLLPTDDRTAEMAKLTENSFRDVNIAFANELSLIADRLDIDVWELIELANHHPRVNILQPGPGVGGHCIAVDPWFIVAAAPEEARLIRTAREVNDAKPRWVIDSICAAASAAGSRPRIALLGLAFKADIDDLRESPAVAITADLARTLPHAEITVVEPHISTLPTPLDGFANVTLAPLDAVDEETDVLVLLVDHSAFRATHGRNIAPQASILDTRGAWR